MRTASTIIVAASLTITAGIASAQVVAPEFAADYTVFDLGPVADVPLPYGGLVFDPSDPSRLLLGGTANNPTAQVYAITVTRDLNGSVISFGCATPVVAFAAPGVTGGIDGGLEFGPGGVIFYTTYSDNQLGQVLPGSSGPDRLDALTPLGVASSTGTLRFVPPGFPGAGRLKIASYNASRWYDATVAPAGDGTYDLALSPTSIQLTGGPEGIVYIAAGNPGFTSPSVLISRFAGSDVAAYEVDANGDPIPATARVFVSGLFGAEGAAIDPVTGDFFFSTFGGGSRIIRVSGFTSIDPCLADLNGDGSVDGADLGILLGSWGESNGGIADLNGDCVINGADLGQLLGAWSLCA